MGTYLEHVLKAGIVGHVVVVGQLIVLTLGDLKEGEKKCHILHKTFHHDPNKKVKNKVQCFEM